MVELPAMNDVVAAPEQNWFVTYKPERDTWVLLAWTTDARDVEPLEFDTLAALLKELQGMLDVYE
jgi:diadenosine tetraphosphate (Ap4A) HIT family hydrolase